MADAESLAERAFHSGGVGTAYLELPEDHWPAEHPRQTWAPYAVGAVGYDVIPHASPLRRLYESPLLLAYLEAVLDRGTLYRYADPCGALNLAVMGKGDELQWHFDQTDFVVSLAIQAAAHGGDFDVAPRIRGADDERYDDVASVLRGDLAPVVTLPMTPGTLLVFEGRHSLHRVSPIDGDTLRHVGLLAYDTSPGTVSSDLLREVRYGRADRVRRAARHMAAFVTQLGEAFSGTSQEAAHVNTVLGAKGGPVETAWATALATPREGHAAFVVAAQPGIAVKPMTLFVNKATIASEDHAALTWGPAQAGVASGVLDAVADGTISAASADDDAADRRGVAVAARERAGPRLRVQPDRDARRPARGRARAAEHR